MKHLASNLYYLRTRNGYTQEELANHLFLTHQTISNHETGKTEPDFSIIQKYADFYHISAEDLLLNDLSKKSNQAMSFLNLMTLDLILVFLVKWQIYSEFHFQLSSYRPF